MCQSGVICLQVDCCFSGIRIMCQSGVIYLHVDCCFTELALSNPSKLVDLVQRGYPFHLIECSLFLP
jgi:hypothetical protein